MQNSTFINKGSDCPHHNNCKASSTITISYCNRSTGNDYNQGCKAQTIFTHPQYLREFQICT